MVGNGRQEEEGLFGRLTPNIRKGAGTGLKLQKKCTPAVSDRAGGQCKGKIAGKGMKSTGNTCYSGKFWELCLQQPCKKGKKMFLVTLIYSARNVQVLLNNFRHV